MTWLTLEATSAVPLPALETFDSGQPHQALSGNFGFREIPWLMLHFTTLLCPCQRKWQRALGLTTGSPLSPGYGVGASIQSYDRPLLLNESTG